MAESDSMDGFGLCDCSGVLAWTECNPQLPRLAGSCGERSFSGRLYETDFWFAAADIAAGLGIGSLVFFVLKQKKEPPRGTTDGSTQK
jgi:hypothetical protein